MKINTSELEGAALDLAVAMAVGESIEINNNISWGKAEPSGKAFIERYEDEPWPGEDSGYITYSPSTDWSQGGPLISEYMVDLIYEAPELWHAERCYEDGIPVVPYSGHYGTTPLIAACRAIVAAKLGDTVDVPEGLV